MTLGAGLAYLILYAKSADRTTFGKIMRAYRAVEITSFPLKPKWNSGSAEDVLLNALDVMECRRHSV